LAFRIMSLTAALILMTFSTMSLVYFYNERHFSNFAKCLYAESYYACCHIFSLSF
jgi:hypothetical protein